MRRTLTLILLLFAAGFPGCAQPTYDVGMGSASIEPDASIFSLALAGYGLPREGRFSITWSLVDQSAGAEAIAGAGRRLYAVSKSGIHTGKANGNEGIHWTKAEVDKGFISIAKGEEAFYAIDRAGVFYYLPDLHDKMKAKASPNGPMLTAIAYMQERLYAVNNGGELLSSAAVASPDWEPVSAEVETGRIVSLTTADSTLYVLNSGDSIFAGKMKGGAVNWTMIGRDNDITFDIDLAGIAAAGNRLYALAEDGKIYINQHRTDGNLSVQALAVREDEATVVIAAADVCGFEYAFIQGVKEEISRRHGLPPDAVLINATHTHFAPVTQDFGPMGPFYENPNEDYMKRVQRGILEAVGEAIEALAPADIYFGRDTTAIGKNRRLSANASAPYDNTVDVLVVRDARDEIKGVLFSTACHPVFRNAGAESYTISANYPGVARSVIAETLDTYNVVFLQGCGGDINPASADHRKTGTDLARDVARAKDRPMHRISGPVSWSLDTIAIPVPMWSRANLEAFREERLAKRGDLEAERDIRWADKMIAYYSRADLPTNLPVYVQIIDIGDWRLVGLSREAVNEYASAIRALWPARKVTVAGYCNDVTSYLPNDWHIRAGVYEGKGSFFWYGAHGTFPLGTYDRIIEAVRRIGVD